MRKIILTILAVLVLGTVQFAMATPVDSNSIVKNGIEYYMQTDKSVYNLGETVEMLYRVTNLGTDDVTFHFDDQVQHYFTVKLYGNLIWDVPKVGFPGGSSFVLSPSGYKEYSETWDMLDNLGILITPGTYDITGSLHPVFLTQQDKDRYVPVSVQIEIIPEPATMLLFGLGSLILRQKFSLSKDGFLV